jgi:hypothetical protein
MILKIENIFDVPLDSNKNKVEITQPLEADVSSEASLSSDQEQDNRTCLRLCQDVGIKGFLKISNHLSKYRSFSSHI